MQLSDMWWKAKDSGLTLVILATSPDGEEIAGDVTHRGSMMRVYDPETGRARADVQNAWVYSATLVARGVDGYGHATDYDRKAALWGQLTAVLNALEEAGEAPDPVQLLVDGKRRHMIAGINHHCMNRGGIWIDTPAV
ncbi:hypothetical protein ABZV77_11490 [Streptomyces sp. NPDC004732]|uniref:hypothetical protein n=1 Tax=Streptomyces sp. NPDC004732 TaxID=3154290 RepID=UPI0033A87A3F